MKNIILFLAFSVCANMILAQENNAEQFEVYFYNNSGYTLYVHPYPISMTFNGSNYYSLMSENPNSNFNQTMYYDYNNAIRNELIGSNMLTLDSITLANGDSKGLKFDCHLCNMSSNAFGNKGYGVYKFVFIWYSNLDNSVHIDSALLNQDAGTIYDTFFYLGNYGEGMGLYYKAICPGGYIPSLNKKIIYEGDQKNYIINAWDPYPYNTYGSRAREVQVQNFL